jgi:hypothetical protein
MKLLVIAIAAAAAGSGYAFHDHLAAPAAQDPQQKSAQHALLHKQVGSWDAVVIMRDEKGAEQRSKGATTVTSLGDFHTVQEFRGEFMGQPFVGHGINGYCPVKKQYYTFWVDSMAPSPLSLAGDYDAAKKELSMTGEYYGPDGKLAKCRTVTRFTDADHVGWEMFGLGTDGKAASQLRIEYSRKK